MEGEGTIINDWSRVIELLIHQQKVSINKLKIILHRSIPTIKKIIEDLNVDLDNTALIEENNGYYSIKIHDSQQFEEMIFGKYKRQMDFNSSEKRQAYLLKKLLIKNNYLIIDELAYELKVSRGTINKDLKELKNKLKHYDIKISGKTNKGIIISGEEYQSRLAYLYHGFDYMGSLISNTESKVEKLLIQDGINYFLEQKYYHLLKKTLNITIDRILLGKSISTMPKYYFQTKLRDQSQIAVGKLFQHIEQTFQIKLTNEEKSFILFPFYIANNLEIEEISKEQKLELKSLYFEMLETIYEVFMVDLNEDILFNELQNHLFYLINRQIFHYSLNDLFFEEIKKNYPFAYELARISLMILNQKIGVTHGTAIDIEASYLALYFELTLYEHFEEHVNKIAIICYTGKGTSTFIRQRLKAIFGENVVLEQFSEKDYESHDFSEYLAIFTTVPLKKKNRYVPFIYMRDLFDLGELSQKLFSTKSIMKYGKLHFAFKLINKNKTYYDMIEEMANELKEEELVDSDFPLKLIEREKKQSTIFEGGIALPHATNSLSEELVFQLGILKNPYITELGTTEFIFLIAIPEKISEKQLNELFELYDAILKLANDTELKEQLRLVENKEQLEEFMRTKGWLR